MPAERQRGEHGADARAGRRSASARPASGGPSSGVVTRTAHGPSSNSTIDGAAYAPHVADGAGPQQRLVRRRGTSSAEVAPAAASASRAATATYSGAVALVDGDGDRPARPSAARRRGDHDDRRRLAPPRPRGRPRPRRRRRQVARRSPSTSPPRRRRRCTPAWRARRRAASTASSASATASAAPIRAIDRVELGRHQLGARLQPAVPLAADLGAPAERARPRPITSRVMPATSETTRMKRMARSSARRAPNHSADP